MSPPRRDTQSGDEDGRKEFPSSSVASTARDLGLSLLDKRYAGVRRLRPWMRTFKSGSSADERGSTVRTTLTPMASSISRSVTTVGFESSDVRDLEIADNCLPKRRATSDFDMFIDDRRTSIDETSSAAAVTALTSWSNASLAGPVGYLLDRYFSQAAPRAVFFMRPILTPMLRSNEVFDS